MSSLSHTHDDSLSTNLDIRLAAGRIVGGTVLVLGLLLAAAASVQPAAAAYDGASKSVSSACLADLSRAKRDIRTWVGGDHVQYDFGARVQRVEQLCESGQVSRGRNLLAEIKADVRSLRNERGSR